ncbi:reverse transcriptase domain-containing protein [Tanacetum coccineum]
MVNRGDSFWDIEISKSGLEVDRAKVEVIAKLPYPTTVKGVRSFLGHAGFYRRFIQDFSKIARPMTHLLEKETPFVFSDECKQAFNDLRKKLIESPILVVPNWDYDFEIMCDASDFALGAVLESLGKVEEVKEINVNDNVLNENENVVENNVLNNVNVLSDNTTPWFADLGNYHAGNFVKKGMSSQ